MNLLSKFIEALVFVEKELDGMTITSDRPNIKAAATLLAVSVDHGQGIRFLISNGAYPSAAALMRSTFETYIRAMWIWKCANQKQVDTFINKDKIISVNGSSISFKELVKEVEFSHEFPAYFSKIQTKVWSGLNSLTHGGNLQLAQNFDGKSIRHCYDDKLIDEMIQFTTMLACMAFAALLDLSDNKNGEEIADQLALLLEPWVFTKQG